MRKKVNYEIFTTVREWLRSWTWKMEFKDAQAVNRLGAHRVS